MQRRPRNPGFGARQASTQEKTADVAEALLRQARKSGQLNLSNRGLTKVPDKVWRVNLDVPPEAMNVSLDSAEDDKWWEQIDLSKLILASNKLTEVSPEIVQLPALAVLDVSICVFIECLQALEEKEGSESFEAWERNSQNSLWYNA